MNPPLFPPGISGGVPLPPEDASVVAVRVLNVEVPDLSV